MKDQLVNIKITSVSNPGEEIKKLWIQGTPLEYLCKLSNSMPKRL